MDFADLPRPRRRSERRVRRPRRQRLRLVRPGDVKLLLEVPRRERGKPRSNGCIQIQLSSGKCSVWAITRYNISYSIYGTVFGIHAFIHRISVS
jgi:hypothetical protein